MQAPPVAPELQFRYKVSTFKVLTTWWQSARLSSMTLTRSTDRKVTNFVTKNGNANIANAFGIPAGVSCPGMTSFCEKICYARKLEKIYRGVSKSVIANFETLLYADYLDGMDGMESLLFDMILEFDKECDRKGAEKKFRIHWDGDFFSRDYAAAWHNVIMVFPAIQFWVYTRSFTDETNVIDILADLPNLTLYLSADPVNIDLANKVAAEYPTVFIATVADTFAEARETIAGDRKAYNCPENGKRIPLISDKGSACVRCGICIDGRGDVLFSAKKR